MKKQIKIFIFLFIVLVSVINSGKCNYIRRETRLIVQKFSRILKKAGISEKKSIALLPLKNTSRGLKIHKIGLGMTELVINAFVNYGKKQFSVIERDQLDRVITEQRFSLTGLTDDSVKTIGGLLSAEYLVTGAVSKLKSLYEIELRLINVETGVIAATHKAKMPIKEFEQQESIKDIIIPRKKTIGAQYSMALIPIVHIENDTLVSVNGDKTYSDVKLEVDILDALGWGNRFYLNESIMGDLGVYSTQEYDCEFNMTEIYPSPGRPSISGGSTLFIMFSMNYIFPVTGWADIFAGAGQTLYTSRSASQGGTLPFVRAGLEVRPKHWLGVNLLLNSFTEEVDFDVDVDPQDGTSLKIFTMKKVFLSSSVVFYF